MKLRGLRTHNLKGIDLDLPLESADRRDGRQRLRKELAGVRHDLRGGSAPIRRDVLGLCTTVPREAGQARRGPDRRHPAGHRGRAVRTAGTPAGARSARSPRSTMPSRSSSPGPATCICRNCGQPVSPGDAGHGLAGHRRPCPRTRVTRSPSRSISAPRPTGAALLPIAPRPRDSRGSPRPAQIVRLDEPGGDRSPRSGPRST